MVCDVFWRVGRREYSNFKFLDSCFVYRCFMVLSLFDAIDHFWCFENICHNASFETVWEKHTKPEKMCLKFHGIYHAKYHSWCQLRTLDQAYWLKNDTCNYQSHSVKRGRLSSRPSYSVCHGKCFYEWLQSVLNFRSTATFREIFWFVSS